MYSDLTRYTIITNKNHTLNKVLTNWLYSNNYILYNVHNLDNIYRFDIWPDKLKVFLFGGPTRDMESVIIQLA